MQQLRELWLDGANRGLASGRGHCLAFLHRCPQLQRVTLQCCEPISRAVLFGLLSQPGLQQLVLRGQGNWLEEGATDDLQAVGATFGCQLLCEAEACDGPVVHVPFNASMQR